MQPSDSKRAVRRKAIAITVLSLLPAPLAGQRPWLADRPCIRALPVTAFRVDTLPPADHRPRCVTLRMGGMVCDVTNDSARIVEVRGFGDSVIAIAHDGLPDTFEVIEADLDGDGRQELALPIQWASSNGMGIDYWTIYLLQPGVAEVVDSVEVQDYSIDGSWVVVPGERRCNLLKTEWVNGIEPGRDEGLYFKATWLGYDYRFVERMDRPVVRRRYLNRFQVERGRRAEDAPLAWLRDRTAVVWQPR